MENHGKLNKLSMYLNDHFYVLNNTDKMMPIDGLIMTQFNAVTINDILLGIPGDEYYSCKLFTSGTENTYMLELIAQEYTMFRSDYEMQNKLTVQFSRILKEIKLLLTGDDIHINYNKINVPYPVLRDNIAANGKQRTVYTEVYEFTFD